MSPTPLLPLAALASVLLAAVALRTARLHLAGGALAAAGAATAMLLFLAGYPGVGMAALACTWGVSAAGLVVGQVLTEVEAQEARPRSGEPWVVALLATGLLVGALALGILAVDWPAAPPPGPGPAPAAAGDLAAWATAVLGAAAALALAALSGRGEEG